LNRRPGWVGVDGRGLLLRQAEAEDPYVLLDLLQEYVSGLDRALKGKKVIYTAVRSFFMHNRVELPRDPSFRVRGSKPPVASKVTLRDLVDIVKSANLRDRSIVLVKWQSMLDNERLVYVGRSLTDQILGQIREGAHPVRLEIPGRKSNDRGYYTFIGKDAVDALVAYFEKERGWPKPGEPIWLQKAWERKVKGLSITGFGTTWLRLIRRIGLIPRKKGPVGSHYGYNPHEMRDIAKSLLHTHAKKDGFDMDCAEFWLGHTVDPLGYDKFYNDQEYVRKQYLIAEKYLNILSTPPANEQVKAQQERLEALERWRDEISCYFEKIKRT